MRRPEPAIQLDLTMDELMDDLDPDWQMWQTAVSKNQELEPGILEAA